MKRNIGETDRIIRTVLAIVIAILIWAKVLTGTLGWIFGALGVLLLLTSLFRFCPLYAILRISTIGKSKAP